MRLKFWSKKERKIDVDSGNFIEIPNSKKNKIQMKIRGKNNRVVIPKSVSGKIKVSIYGDNNSIIIGTERNLYITVSIGVCDSCCHNSLLEIGEETAANGVNFMLLENNSIIKIGKDCMLSSNIDIWCSDTHTVCDRNGKVTNIGKSIEIGNHVWVGKDCHITKNTKIADNSIVGWCSNITKKFDEPNVIIAGNPAQIVKRNIEWKRERPQNFLDMNNNA